MSDLKDIQHHLKIRSLLDFLMFLKEISYVHQGCIYMHIYIYIYILKKHFLIINVEDMLNILIETMIFFSGFFGE